MGHVSRNERSLHQGVLVPRSYHRHHEPKCAPSERWRVNSVIILCCVAIALLYNAVLRRNWKYPWYLLSPGEAMCRIPVLGFHVVRRVVFRSRLILLLGPRIYACSFPQAEILYFDDLGRGDRTSVGLHPCTAAPTWGIYVVRSPAHLRALRDMRLGGLDLLVHSELGPGFLGSLLCGILTTCRG